MSDDLHIASLVLRHRAEARTTIETAVAAAPGLEIALQGENRSVLLQESAETAGLMGNIDLLQNLAGVLNVSLVYHHIESRAALDLPAAHASAPGEPA